MRLRAISKAGFLASALVAAFAAGPADAQQQPVPVATLRDLQGNVLVSQGDAMAAAANTQRLAPGARVVTTAGAKATVSYDNGCNVTLKENERFTVRIAECTALMGEVVALGPAPGAIGGGVAAAPAGAPSAAVVAGTVGGVAAVGGLGYGAYEVFRKSPVSPN